MRNLLSIMLNLQTHYYFKLHFPKKWKKIQGGKWLKLEIFLENNILST